MPPSDKGLSLLSPTVRTDLNLWKRLTSSLDMDKNSKPSSRSPAGSGRGGRSSRARSGSTQPAPASVASGPSRAAAHHSHAGEISGWPQQQPPVPLNAPRNYEEVARALRTLQDAHPLLVQSMAYPQQGFPWDPNQFPPTVPPQLTSQPPWLPTQPSTSHGVAAPLLPLDFGSLYPPGGNHSPPSAHYPTPSSPVPISTEPGESSFQAFATTHTQENAPLDAEASAEEKRRRNTAASARFRVKKKLKTLNLERTVSDLTGRIDELEQEASDLKRENTWLKEIVVLKSRRGDPQAGPSSSSHGSRRDIDEDAEEESRPSDEEKGSDA